VCTTTACSHIPGNKYRTEGNPRGRLHGKVPQKACGNESEANKLKPGQDRPRSHSGCTKHTKPMDRTPYPLISSTARLCCVGGEFGQTREQCQPCVNICTAGLYATSTEPTKCNTHMPTTVKALHKCLPTKNACQREIGRLRPVGLLQCVLFVCRRPDKACDVANSSAHNAFMREAERAVVSATHFGTKM
jgi:hypothetical protein